MNQKRALEKTTTSAYDLYSVYLRELKERERESSTSMSIVSKTLFPFQKLLLALLYSVLFCSGMLWCVRFCSVLLSSILLNNNNNNNNTYLHISIYDCRITVIERKKSTFLSYLIRSSLSESCCCWFDQAKNKTTKEK